MKRFYKLIFINVFSILSFISCNEDPTSVGIDLLPSTDKIDFKLLDTKDTPLFQKSNTFQSDVDLNFAYTRIIGKNSYAESTTLVKFNIIVSDSILTQLKNNQLTINKAWINIRPSYSLGNINTFDFSAHQIRSKWSATGFDRDSLPHLQYDAGNVSFNKTINDTSFNFSLQTTVVKEWMQYKADTLSAPKNHGLILKPTSGSNAFLGFVAARYTDHLNLPKLFIEIERASVYKDTLVVTPATDIHVVKGTLPAQDKSIYLQGGLALQSSLFFDLSLLPKNTIINSARLELTVDTLKSFDSKPKSDSIFVQALKDSTLRTFTGDSLISTILNRTGAKYEGDITWMIQKWITGYENYSNHGMLISLVDENSTIARIQIYGTKEADINKRPRLKITYMKKK